MAVPVAAAATILVLVLVGAAWWVLRPRPTLEGAAGRIASGRYRAAEEQLRAYLGAYPGDEPARLMLARVLVDRPEPDPVAALGLIEGLGTTDPRRLAQVKAIEGDAHYWSGRYVRAEAAWLEALRLEPTIPEVGWKLLNIYAIQGRVDDSRRLALRLFASEPDERDRVQLLLQLIRHDAHPIEAGSIVHELEPIVRANPADVSSSAALGLALIRTGRADEGLAILRRAARSKDDPPDAWFAYLEGLIEAGGLDELATSLEGLPRSLADSPRIDAARGWLAAQRRDLGEAVKDYRRALDVRPSDAVLAYRLKGVLRQSDRLAELAELAPRLDAVARFPDVARDFFDRLGELPDLGLHSQPEAFARVGEALRQVGRDDEAEAWDLLAHRPPRGPR